MSMGSLKMNSMADLWLLILLLVSLTTHRLDASKYLCSDEPFATFPFSEDNLCIEVDNAPSFNRSGTNDSQTKEIKMSLIKEESALEVQFPVSNSGDYDKYDLMLKVIKPEGNKCPERVDFHHGMNTHSRNDFHILKCSDLSGFSMADCTPVCKRTGVVKFNYIFTGCYQVGVRPVLNFTPRGMMIKSKLQYFETNYTMQRIADMVPTIEPVCTEDGSDSNGDGRMDLQIYLTNPFFQDRLPLKLWLSHGRCAYGDDDGHYAAWVVQFEEGEFTCQRQSGKAPQFCQKIENVFSCSFRNVSVGSHCVTLIPWDVTRCRSNTLWTEFSRCGSYYEFACNKSLPKVALRKETPNGLDPIIISIAVVVSVCCIVGIIYFIFHRRKLRRRIAGSNVDLVATPIHKSHPHVLLLYAQDCNEFMKLMETFRSVLSNVCECEVLDCFDPNREGEIADNPIAWMRHHASSPEMKVVVVASECAMRHQVAIEGRTELSYFEPLPRCRLFQYGLQEVTNNPKRSYTNTFVVRFDNTDLNYITLFTRFKLPLMLKDLLTNLNPGLDLSHMEEFRDVHKLRENCEELIRYKQEHPEYFTKLIARLEDPVTV